MPAGCLYEGEHEGQVSAKVDSTVRPLHFIPHCDHLNMDSETENDSPKRQNQEKVSSKHTGETT